MSDSDKAGFPDFGKLVPGFDFLQNLTRQATAGAASGVPKLPQLGGWVAPTMNVEELDKRISELKTVQFWLDQNATALKATIQALEVQKMTLATLAGMNVNMSEIAKAFSVAMPAGMGAAAPSAPASKAKSPQFSGLEVPATSYQPSPATAPAPAPAAAPAQPAAAAPAPAPSAGTSDAAPAASAGPAAVDPLQWWGALTQQFQSIAASALQEAAARSPIDPIKATAAARPASATGAKTVAKKAVKKVVKTVVKKAPSKASPKAPSKAAGKTSGAAVKTASKASAARKGAARSR